MEWKSFAIIQKVPIFCTCLYCRSNSLFQVDHATKNVPVPFTVYHSLCRPPQASRPPQPCRLCFFGYKSNRFAPRDFFKILFCEWFHLMFERAKWHHREWIERCVNLIIWGKAVFNPYFWEDPNRWVGYTHPTLPRGKVDSSQCSWAQCKVGT